MIEIKDGEIFKKLAEKYNIKYRRTPTGENYEIESGQDINEKSPIKIFL